jgi:hypothetical protein
MDGKKLSSDFTLERYGVQVRLANENDSEFILSLRTNEKLSRFLHSTDNDLQKQISWMKEYKKREREGKDYYFIFSKDGKPLGLERLYDIEGDHFTHGSLIFSEEAPFGTSILSDIITREIAFNDLGFLHNYFDVRKKNVNVRNYHLKYKPSLIYEDDDNYYYVLEKDNFEKNKHLYLNLFFKNDSHG